MNKAIQPKVSVVIPVYNAEKYLEQCYVALAKQTYRNLELVFVNDCSEDNSLDLLRRFERVDQRVVLLDLKSNVGVSAARNAGIAVSKGAFIGFCDADDTCEPTMFERMLSVAERYNADVVCCGLARVSSKGEFQEKLWESDCEFAVDSFKAMKYWLTAQYIGNSIYTKLFKKELWNDIWFPENEIFEEAKVIPQLLVKANRIAHTGTVEYHYHARESSITSKPPDERLLAVFRREIYIRDFVLKRYPEMEEEVTAFEVRNNMNVMMSAEVARKTIDADLYKEIATQFGRVCIPGLRNRYIPLRVKLKLIELRTGAFSLRKYVQSKIRGMFYRRNHTNSIR